VRSWRSGFPDPDARNLPRADTVRPFCAVMTEAWLAARPLAATSTTASPLAGCAGRRWPCPWRLAGPLHHLAGPCTTSRGTYRGKYLSYSRVLVQGQGKWCKGPGSTPAARTRDPPAARPPGRGKHASRARGKHASPRRQPAEAKLSRPGTRTTASYYDKSAA